MNWPEPGTPVIVRWYDAEVDTAGGWWDVSKDDLAKLDLLTSVGVFIDGGAWGVILAFSFDGEAGALGSLTIPGNWIDSMSLLVEAQA